jgi:hypothetical protein
MDKNFYLISKENEKIKFSSDLKNYSSLLFDMLENDDIYDEIDVDIPITKFSSEVLNKMIEFFDYYKEKPYTYLNKPLKSPNLSDNISDTWYSTFIESDEISEEFLFDLMDCANFFSFNALLELCCAEAGSILYKQDLNKET